MTQPTPKPDRNAALMAEYRRGASVSDMAAQFGISVHRVCDIIRKQVAEERGA